MGVALTTLEQLDGWKESGVITDAQHVTLSEIVRRDRFSLFVELNALLYIGVISIVAGLALTVRNYDTRLGDVVILSVLALLMAVSFGYCFVRAPSYSNGEVESPSFAFDYVLYFACLVLSATLAFIETRFQIFHGWDTHLLSAALVFGLLAYRFDNRFVLSLSLSTLAAYLGLRISGFDTLDTNNLRFAGFMYGVFLIGVGVLLKRIRIKPHFLDVYLQLGANAVLLATASGVLDDNAGWVYLVALLVFAAVSIYLGIRFRRFAFVAYGTLFGYAGLSARLLDAMGDVTGALAYFVVTGSLVILALVLVARRFGRDE
ncbi:MAG TPA: DUF2157 domain-containing protein [Vicinamibacterales bacterium]|nr:DUF2157 domain-containing protein [Vicinamibacterales bacterium]